MKRYLLLISFFAALGATPASGAPPIPPAEVRLEGWEDGAVVVSRELSKGLRERLLARGVVQVRTWQEVHEEALLGERYARRYPSRLGLEKVKVWVGRLVRASFVRRGDDAVEVTALDAP